MHETPSMAKHLGREGLRLSACSHIEKEIEAGSICQRCNLLVLSQYYDPPPCKDS